MQLLSIYLQFFVDRMLRTEVQEFQNAPEPVMLALHLWHKEIWKILDVKKDEYIGVK